MYLKSFENGRSQIYMFGVYSCVELSAWTDAKYTDSRSVFIPSSSRLSVKQPLHYYHTKPTTEINNVLNTPSQIHLAYSMSHTETVIQITLKQIIWLNINSHYSNHQSFSILLNTYV